MNPRIRGQFENERLNEGYFLEVAGVEYGILGREKMLYRCVINPNRPPTFIQADGTRIRTCREFPTDQGSQPVLVQGWLPKDRHIAVYFHDDGYRAGGLWIAAPGETEFRFVPLTRADLDQLLRTMLTCGQRPISRLKADGYWVGVRIGAAWDKLAFWREDMYKAWRPGRAGTSELYATEDSRDVDDCLPMGVGS
jgi:hypothetical protein